MPMGWNRLVFKYKHIVDHLTFVSLTLTKIIECEVSSPSCYYHLHLFAYCWVHCSHFVIFVEVEVVVVHVGWGLNLIMLKLLLNQSYDASSCCYSCSCWSHVASLKLPALHMLSLLYRIILKLLLSDFRLLKNDFTVMKFGTTMSIIYFFICMCCTVQ